MADKLIVTYRGTEYPFELSVTVAEARIIKKLTRGMGVSEWLKGMLYKGDADALAAMVYLAKRRAGETVVWKDFDDMDVLEDIDIRDADDEGEDEETDPALADDDEDEAPDPTPTGTIRKSGSSSTSRPSGTSSRSTRRPSTS